MSTQIQPLLTLADLDAVPDDGNRYEIVEGDLFVTRAPHLSHQSALSNLLYAMRESLRRDPVGKVFPEIGVIFGEHDAVIPDLLFVTNEKFRRHVSGGKLYAAPDLVVEILSGGTENERRDRQVKRRLYAKHGVTEYWIVDWELKTVEVYRLESSGLELQATLGGRDELTFTLLPGFVCRVEDIFEV